MKQTCLPFQKMTNWDARDLTLDLSFLAPGTYEAEIFRDGINADRDGTDYKKEIKKIAPGEKLNIHLSKVADGQLKFIPCNK